MSLSFEKKLQNYAQLGLVHGLGLGQTIRPLYIESYQIEDHNNFIPLLAEVAYELGVKTVDARYRYPELERAMFKGAPDDQKLYVPEWITRGAELMIKRDAARIALNGNGELGIMDDVDQTLPSRYKSAFVAANEPYSSRRMKMLQPWTILDVPTKAWAKKLGMSIEDLWEFLFTITGADREDGLEYARGVNNKLHARCDLLNKLHIHCLHFQGKGTDLFVGLSTKARWMGGSKAIEDGTWFGPNWPSFEIYTTPDYRKTEGTVSVTMPSVLHGPIVEGLKVSFSRGRVVEFSATKGLEAFESLINHDHTACQLGEIALVGLDSPLSSYTEPHFCGMLDENKRCHMAFGGAYAAALEGGREASEEELETLGCNKSGVHHDMMISDKTTSVTALNSRGQAIAFLMENGRWTEEFI